MKPQLSASNRLATHVFHDGTWWVAQLLRFEMETIQCGKFGEREFAARAAERYLKTHLGRPDPKKERRIPNRAM